ncbi:MAG: tRNA (guanine(10)-N(2))-dimethyltransferase [Candidatus Bathyarchaeota archaeon]|nr:MAG: tRNA (guanine(10)-N(2))-dimethyltransferase [Candidatus Bathyarchaeota archaeon]
MEQTTFSFPREVLREGRVSVVVPELEAYATKPWDYAPSKAPVFFNPVMKLNRDIAVLALRAYQSASGRALSVCEPLAGCGIRGVRFAVEVDGEIQIVLNDINPEAAKLTQLNVARNELADCIRVTNEDANLLMSRFAAPRKRFDLIDVDPFGSPAPYIDAAIRAVRNDGLLALTATDMAPLCGVHLQACIRKYGGRPLRTEYCHELAVRLLAGCLTMMAAKHGIGIRVLFSHSTDHYIRLYALIQYGARRSDRSVQQMGYILHCFSCLHREVVAGMFSPLRLKCPDCGFKLSVAGPLWTGRLVDKDFCASMITDAVHRNSDEKLLLKLLSLIEGEADAPVTYYTTDKICDRLKVPIPPLMQVIEVLGSLGFPAVRTHFNSTGIKTEAPASDVASIVSSFSSSKPDHVSP